MLINATKKKKNIHSEADIQLSRI